MQLTKVQLRDLQERLVMNNTHVICASGRIHTKLRHLCRCGWEGCLEVV